MVVLNDALQVELDRGEVELGAGRVHTLPTVGSCATSVLSLVLIASCARLTYESLSDYLTDNRRTVSDVTEVNAQT